MPAIIREFDARNEEVDVVIVDNTITLPSDARAPWFEAIVRALHRRYPACNVVLVIDATRGVEIDQRAERFV